MCHWVSYVKVLLCWVIHSKVFAQQIMETSTAEEGEGKAFLSRIASVESLRDAWKHLNKSNPTSYGLSGETIAAFTKDLDAKIDSLMTS
jgi:hypothetical protein